MRKSGLPARIAALVCGVFAAAVAQAITVGSFLSSGEGSASARIAPEQENANVLVKSADVGKEAPRAGNPLWAIPLADLSQTNARPLFSPSRRPPAPPTYALASAPAKSTPAPKAGPDHPLLTLLGTIVSRSVEIGVFADEASHDVIRLKAGDVHDGWTLSSVVGRAAFFQKAGYRAATLALPAPGAKPTASNGGTAKLSGTGGNSRIISAPPVSSVVPANTEGGSRRPPKEG